MGEGQDAMASVVAAVVRTLGDVLRPISTAGDADAPSPARSIALDLEADLRDWHGRGRSRRYQLGPHPYGRDESRTTTTILARRVAFAMWALARDETADGGVEQARTVADTLLDVAEILVELTRSPKDRGAADALIESLAMGAVNLRVVRGIHEPLALRRAIHALQGRTARATLAWCHARLAVDELIGPRPAAVAAFDAAEMAIGHLAAADGQVPEAVDAATAQVQSLVALRELDGLAELVTIATTPPPTRSAAARAVLDGDLPTDAHERATAEAIGRRIDDHRRLLHGEAVATDLAASWIDWGYRHPAFNGSVPLRTADLSTLPPVSLLQLVHELTHTWCFRSLLGDATLAARYALGLTEVFLWDRSEAISSLDGLGQRALAPLTGADVEALAGAEHALDIATRLDVISRTWSPWLEAVAVLSELGADPRSDPDVSGVQVILTHLIDDEISGDVADRMAQGTTHLQSSEASVGAALDQVGTRLLWGYLGANFNRYGPGYLVLRSVVSRWRVTLGRNLGGSEAARLLIHALVYGSGDALPPFSVPVAAFEEAAITSMVAWVARLARLTRDDLELLVAGGAIGWSDGHPTTTVHAEALADEWDASWLELVRQLTTNEPSVRPWLVQEPDLADDRAAAHQALRAWFGTAGWNDAALAARDGDRATATILVLGRARSTWWLEPDGRTLRTHIPQPEQRDAQGAYAEVAIELTPDEVASLVAHRAVTADRRLDVYRVVDTDRTVDDDGATRAGRHHVVLACGTWLRVLPVGLVVPPDRLPGPDAPTGPSVATAVEADVRQAILLDPITRAGRVFADPVASGTRTARWLLQLPADWSTRAGVIDAEAWTTDVLRRALDLVSEGPAEPGPAAIALLEAAFGSPQWARGLRATVAPDADLDETVEFIFASATEPLAAAPQTELAHQSELGWDIRPFGTRPGADP